MKNFKILGVIHLADIIWLALLAAIVYGATQFSLPREVSAQVGDARIRYTIEIGGRRLESGEPRVFHAGFHESIQIGDTLFDALRGLPIGEITAVEAQPFRINAFDEEAGIIRHATVENFEFTYIIVETAVSITEYETLAGGLPLQVGRNVAVRTGDFASEGYIVAMEVIE